jgi:citrate synthase
VSSKGSLEGVVVADMETSLVDGAAGVLIYAGYDIDTLAQNALYEEIVFLLHHLRLPNQAELEVICRKIATQAVVPAAIIDLLRNMPKTTPAMAVLRTAVSLLAAYDPDAENLTDKIVAREKALRLTGQVATICAAWTRIKADNEPLAPRTDLTLAQNFIYMLTGNDPDLIASAAVNVYLVLLAEHGMNPSTFTTRVITTTHSDMHSAIVGGIAALKGPLHGGANTETMKMFLEIGAPKNVENWFQTQIKAGGRRIMGMGHPIYKVLDPRAAILKHHAERLAASSGNSKWFEIADRLEQLARSDDYFMQRKLYPNVDYYSAIVLYTLNLEVDMFTPLFAMARMAGWTANIIDQMQGRIIRPDANYTGARGLSWIPLAER